MNTKGNKKAVVLLGLGALGVLGVLWTTPARAQEATGSVASGGCSSLIVDNAAAGGELYAIKTHNPGHGPDHHQDILFDLRAKGGASIAGVNVGGSMYQIQDVWKKNITPPEDMFAIVTYPNGWMAIDSGNVRNTDLSYGTVSLHRVGNALPVGVASGTGVELSGSSASYQIPIISNRVEGGVASFPFGTRDGIEVAFAPLAEVNSSEWSSGSGCSIGGEVEDPHARFGLVVGYNVFRVAGSPDSPPLPADFIGNWQYYMRMDDFVLGEATDPVSDTSGTAILDINGDTLPDGDGTDAPTDPNADGDLVGLQNPDGIPYTGDEILIFQDSAKNPDGTLRAFGTPPDLSGATGYWYAFQPVLFSGPSTLQDFADMAFTRADLFEGDHTMDLDGNTLVDALDLDLDGSSAEFYSPQAEFGIQGYGLTNGGAPLLSPPVFGRANPAIAVGDLVLQGTPISAGYELVLAPAFERTDVAGYNVYRVTNNRTQQRQQVNPYLLVARGGPGNLYRLTDRWVTSSRRLAPTRVTYLVEIVFVDGSDPLLVGPFNMQVSALRRR